MKRTIGIIGGAQRTVLGCMELPAVLARDAFDAPIKDSTRGLTESVIEYAGGRVRV